MLVSSFYITNHILNLTHLGPEEGDSMFLEHWYPLIKLHRVVVQKTIIFQVYRPTIPKNIKIGI